MLLALDLKNFTSQPGGIAGMYTPLISRLADAENLQIIGLAPNNSYENNYNFPILRIGLPAQIPLPNILKSLLYNHWFFPKALKRTKADIFLSPYFDVSFNKTITSIITIHDMCFFEVPRQYSFLRRAYFQHRTRRSAQNASLILTDSQTSKKYIRDFLNLPENKIRIVQNELDANFRDYDPTLEKIELFKSKHRISGSAKILLYSGGFENRKNIENLLKSAFEALSKGFFDKVLITGGSLKLWRKALIDLGLDDSNFVFTGVLNSDDIKLAYHVSWAMIFPSFSEGFGRPNMEAMALGIPIACSDIPVFREFCQDYSTYFNPHSITSIVSALSSVSCQKRHPPRYLNQYGISADGLAELLEEVSRNHAS